jgi:hypothetical protein
MKKDPIPHILNYFIRYFEVFSLDFQHMCMLASDYILFIDHFEAILYNLDPILSRN